MYSVRKTTKRFGNVNLNVLVCVLIITGVLIWQFGVNYLVIFISCSFLHIIIESGLSIGGIRKGFVYVYGYKLPRLLDILLRSFVEGPGFCVPAYFIADNLIQGNAMTSVLVAIIVVGLASFYMGWNDKKNIEKLSSDKEVLISRRAMTKPKAVMLLALLNTGCIAAMFLIPVPFRNHAFIYLISYSGLVLLFYFINYNLGVRFIEIYDHDSKKFNRPGTAMQVAGLTYDSAYEMAILISPAYWIPFYLGLFH